MASTSSPYGFEPISDMTGVIRPLRIPNGITSGYGYNIFTNTPVTLDPSTGTIAAVRATTDQIFGVFIGCEYTPTGGDPRKLPFWAANATFAVSSGNNAIDDMYAYVIPAWLPGVRYRVQADGIVAQTALGMQFNVSNFTDGSTITGQAACTVAYAGVADNSQGQFVLEEFYPGINSAVGDAYTDLIVGIAYPQIGNGYQNSIG